MRPWAKKIGKTIDDDGETVNGDSEEDMTRCGEYDRRRPVEVVRRWVMMASDLGQPVVVFDERREGEGREDENYMLSDNSQTQN